MFEILIVCFLFFCFFSTVEVGDFQPKYSWLPLWLPAIYGMFSFLFLCCANVPYVCLYNDVSELGGEYCASLRTASSGCACGPAKHCAAVLIFEGFLILNTRAFK